MNDIRLTKDQLIKELRTLRRKTASLEKKLKEKPVVPPWQSTFDSLNDAVCILDQNGVIQRCNGASKTLFGKPLSKLIGKKCWGVVYGTSKIPIDGCSFARMLQTGQRESTEKRLKDRWFRITTDPVKDKNGQLLGAVYVLSDITRLKQMELSLHESQRLYARAEQMGNFGHWSRDYITDKANWSAGMYHLFGIRPEEFRRDFDFFLSLVDPADIEHLRRSIEVSMSTHTPLDVEYRIRRPDGEERLIHSTAEILFGERSQAVGLFGICQDITEQRRAEETLRESEKRFSTIFHFSPISIAITRLRDNQLIDVNEAWQEITGFTREEVIGHPATELNLWADPEERSRLMTALADQGLVRGFEVVIRRKSGNNIHLLFSAGLITIEGEQCMLSMALDITGRKQLEEALQTQTRLLRTLIDGIPDIIALQKPDHTILFYNRAGYKFLNKSPEAVDGRKCYRLIGRNTLCEKCATSMAIQSKKIEVVEKYLPDYQIWLEARAIPVLDEKKELQAVVEILRDITERKLAEEALKESEERFRLLFHGMRDAIYVHEASPEKPGRFIAVNESACRMLGYTEEDLLRMDVKDIDIPEQAGHILAIHEKLFREGHALFETFHVAKDGRKIPVEINVRLFTLRGKTMVLSVARDISERIKTEEKIKIYHKRLSELASKIALIAEDERRRFADELHDLTGQNLALAKIKLSELRDSLTR